MGNRLGIDPDKFQHVSSDDQKTILKHKDGHQLVIAHKKLSPKMQEQLKALAGSKSERKEAKSDAMSDKSDKEPAKVSSIQEDCSGGPVKKMADGGPTDDSEESQQVDFNSNIPAAAQDPVPANDYLAAPTGASTVDPSDMATAEQAPYGDNQAALLGGGQPVAQDRSLAGGASQEAAIADQQPKMPQSPIQLAEQSANLEAQAISNQGKAEAAALVQKKEDLAQVETDYRQKLAETEAENKRLSDEYRNGDVRPDQYWTGDKDGNGGHSRVMSAIGMIIAGFGGVQAVQNVSNFLDKQIDRNIEVQKANLGKTKTLLDANLQKYKDLRSAETATRLNLNDAAITELQLAAAKAKTPLAQAAAMHKIADLRQKQKVLADGLATNRMIKDMTSGAMKPEVASAALDELAVKDPARAKALRERFVPGAGFAGTNEGAKTIREMQGTTKSVMDGVSALRKILDKSGKSFNLATRKEAETIRNSMIGALRVPMTGPGAMNEGERKLMEEMIPDVTSMTSLDAVSKKGLSTLEKIMQQKYDNSLRANGLGPQQLSKPQSTSNDQAKAIQWAKANPKDPRAAKILQLHGQ